MAYDVLHMISQVTPGIELKYNKHYVGLARHGVPDNFVTVLPRREYLVTRFRIDRSDDVSTLVEESGMDLLPYDNQWGYYRVRLTRNDIDAQRGLLLNLVRLASGTPESPVEFAREPEQAA